MVEESMRLYAWMAKWSGHGVILAFKFSGPERTLLDSKGYVLKFIFKEDMINSTDIFLLTVKKNRKFFGLKNTFETFFSDFWASKIRKNGGALQNFKSDTLNCANKSNFTYNLKQKLNFGNSKHTLTIILIDRTSLKKLFQGGKNTEKDINMF